MRKGRTKTSYSLERPDRWLPPAAYRDWLRKQRNQCTGG
jgi:hypothetical protein